MIAPARHVADIDELEDQTLGEILIGAKSVVRTLRELYHPHGFNVGFNLGEAAGAGIEEHIHLHVVPRWRADTNFISVVGDARVIPEELAVSYRRVSEALRRELSGGHGE